MYITLVSKQTVIGWGRLFVIRIRIGSQQMTYLVVQAGNTFVRAV
jgi:hypothetical protein